jgi:prevent-host-death family protein
MKSTPTVRIVSATEAKNKFGEIIKHAYAADEHLIVEKSGIPVVAIIPMADYQQLVSARTVAPAVERKVDAESSRAEASRRLGELLAQVHATMPDYPEEEVDRDIAQAIAEVRAEQAQKVAAESRTRYKTKKRSRR